MPGVLMCSISALEHFKCFICCCLFAAHEDSLWSCAWAKNERDGSENIVTGGVDDLVKIWKW